jgi:hypothetical protein
MGTELFLSVKGYEKMGGRTILVVSPVLFFSISFIMVWGDSKQADKVTVTECCCPA